MRTTNNRSPTNTRPNIQCSKNWSEKFKTDKESETKRKNISWLKERKKSQNAKKSEKKRFEWRKLSENGSANKRIDSSRPGAAFWNLHRGWETAVGSLHKNELVRCRAGTWPDRKGELKILPRMHWLWREEDIKYVKWKDVCAVGECCYGKATVSGCLWNVLEVNSWEIRHLTLGCNKHHRVLECFMAYFMTSKDTAWLLSFNPLSTASMTV